MAVTTAPAVDFHARMRAHEKRNFTLVVLDSAMFAFAISLLAEATIIPAFVQSLTGSAALVGLVGATYALGRYLPQLVGAHLVLGKQLRKPTLFWIVVAERVGILAIALTAQLVGIWDTAVIVPLFFVAFGAYAVTTGLIGPVYGDFLAKGLPRTRGWYYGLSQLMGGVLGFASAMTAERILDSWAFPTGNQIAFWLCFVLSFISIPIVAGLKDEPYPDVEPRDSLLATFRRIPAIVAGDGAYRRFLGVRALLALATAGMGFVVVHGLAEGYISAPDAALLAAVFILAQAGGGFLLSLMGNYLGWKTVVVAGGVALAAGMGGALVVQDLLGLGLVYALLGIANAATIVGDPNMSIELAPPALTSIYLGTTSTLLAPFFVFGPLVGGGVAQGAGYPVVFAAAGISAVLGLVLALFLPEPRRLRRDEPVVVGQPGTLP